MVAQGHTLMGISANSTFAAIVSAFAATKTKLEHRLRALVTARRRRIELEQEFYRNFKAYCDANNLPPASEDDWRARM